MNKGPRGLIFKNELERKYAYLFESLEWNWEYEPILKDITPSFIIKLGVHGEMPIVVIICPSIDNPGSMLEAYEIWKTGYDGYILFLGSMPQKGCNEIVDWGNCLEFGSFWIPEPCCLEHEKNIMERNGCHGLQENCSWPGYSFYIHYEHNQYFWGIKGDNSTGFWVYTEDCVQNRKLSQESKPFGYSHDDHNCKRKVLELWSKAHNMLKTPN